MISTDYLPFSSPSFPSHGLCLGTGSERKIDCAHQISSNVIINAYPGSKLYHF